MRSYGRTLTARESFGLLLAGAARLGLSADQASTATASLSTHVRKEATLTGAEIEAAAATISSMGNLIQTNKTGMLMLLALIDDYESEEGPLFVTAAT